MTLARWIRTMALAVGLAAGAPVASQACSPVQGYVRPSNFELVQIADAIVVAQPVGQEQVPGGDRFDRKVRFRITQTLKGQAAGQIEVSGLMLGRTQPSDPREIVFSHPEGHMGPCNRMTLSKGASYVLFLKARGPGYVTLGYPFSRVSEDYAGEDALWTRTIRTYLRVQNGEAPMAQLTALEAIRDGLLDKATPSHDALALAADIDQHLGAPSPWKPTAYLLATLDDLKAGRPPRYRPRNAAFDAEQSSAGAYTDLIMRELGVNEAKPAPPRRDARQTALLEMLITGEHPDAMPVFDALAAPGAPADDLAMTLRFYAKNGRYRDAYRLIEDRAVPMIATAPEGDARLLLAAIGEVQQDPFYDQGQPRWRNEPDIAQRWPKLALKLTQVSVERFDADPGYTETLKGVLGSDYRANPDLTLMLSGHFNEIGDWAARELTREENLAASTGGPDDPLRLPMRVVLRWMGLSEGEKDVAALTPAFCLGSAQRQMLFRDIGPLGSTHAGREILQFAAASVVTRRTGKCWRRLSPPGTSDTPPAWTTAG